MVNPPLQSPNPIPVVDADFAPFVAFAVLQARCVPSPRDKSAPLTSGEHGPVDVPFWRMIKVLASHSASSVLRPDLPGVHRTSTWLHYLGKARSRQNCAATDHSWQLWKAGSGAAMSSGFSTWRKRLASIRGKRSRASQCAFSWLYVSKVNEKLIPATHNSPTRVFESIGAIAWLEAKSALIATLAKNRSGKCLHIQRTHNRPPCLMARLSPDRRSCPTLVASEPMRGGSVPPCR